MDGYRVRIRVSEGTACQLLSSVNTGFWPDFVRGPRNQTPGTDREWTQPSPKRYGGQAANEREFRID